MLNVGEDADPVIVVVAVVFALFAVGMITAGVSVLARRRAPARVSGAWKKPVEYGWFSVTMGFSLLLTSMTFIAVGLHWRARFGGWRLLGSSWRVRPSTG